MRLSSIFAPIVAAVACACAVPMQPAAKPSTPAYPESGAFATRESQIFDLINAERRRRGLPALVYNPQLDQMAKIQARQMATFQKMAHVLPGAEMPTLADRAHRVGYTYGRIAENVALGYPSPDAVVEGWMTSKGHRENILDRDVVETGIGMARSSAGGLYYCQVFGRRLMTF
jgi:uncharacterized protein YkwD